MGNTLCSCQCPKCNGSGTVRNPYGSNTYVTYISCYLCKGGGITKLPCNYEKCKRYHKKNVYGSMDQ